MTETRETILTIAGQRHVVRTDIGGTIHTVRQMEAAHMHAVRSAIAELRERAVRERYAGMLPDESDEIFERRHWHDCYAQGTAGPLTELAAAAVEHMVTHCLAEKRKRAEEYLATGLRAARPHSVSYSDHRKLRAPWRPPARSAKHG